MVRRNTKFSKRTIAMLESRAAAEKKTKSQLIVELIEKYINTTPVSSIEGEKIQNFYISKETDERIGNLAEKQSISKGSVIRSFVRYGLGL